MIKNKNYLLIFFLLIYTIFGIYLSITTGISHDEFHEQLNWEININAIKSFIQNRGIESLSSYEDKYHGIGFHFISQPIQLLTREIISDYIGVTNYGGHLLAKHAVVFLLFSISGIFFYLMCLKTTNNGNFSILSTSIYLLFPYLFGHAQFNPKDIPFLSIWIINSYFFLIIIEDFLHENETKITKIFLVSFFTGFLISIRILGFLIFLEFLIGLIILFNIKKINILLFLKEKYKLFFLFIIFFSFFLYILNPIFWTNPLEIFNSIQWMSKYFNDVCTVTLGKCLKSLNLPASYYFIWFFFKIPIIILLGFLIFPLVEKKIFKNKITTIYYGTFLFTLLSILLILILKKIAIYNEIRHIMFLIPMIFIISLTNIFYFSKFFFFSVIPFFLFFFILENYSTNPYQYTWLNSFAKFTNIEKNFEVDYWGLSNKNLQNEIIKFSQKNSINKNICVYGDLYAKEFLSVKNFKCFKNYSQLDSAKQRPFFAYKNVANVRRSNPKDCQLIWNEKYKYSFYKKDISTGTLWFCD